MQTRTGPVYHWLATRAEPGREQRWKEIARMQLRLISINATTGIPICMKIQDTQEPTLYDGHLQDLNTDVIEGWVSSRAHLQQHIWPYWTFRDKIKIIYRVAMKGRQIIISAQVQSKALEQLHNSCMGMENTRLLAQDSLYWLHMYADIKEPVKSVQHIWSISKCNLKTK